MWPWCPRAASAEHPHPSGTCPLQRQAGAQGCPDLCPPPPGSLGAAEQTAVLTGVQAERLAGRVPLRICGESRASQHAAWQSPETLHLQPRGEASEARASRTPPGTAQAKAGCCPSESPARAFLPMATQGHLPQASQEKPGPHWRHLCRSWGERSAGPGAPPRAPAQKGHRGHCKWAPDLRVLVKRFLISAMVAWGSTWGKHRPQRSQGGVGHDRGPLLVRGDGRGPGQLLWEGEGWSSGSPPTWPKGAARALPEWGQL